MKGDHEKKSDGVRVHHEKERWGDFTIKKSDGMRVHQENKTDGVRLQHERKRDGVRVHHEKERWGKSLT